MPETENTRLSHKCNFAQKQCPTDSNPALKKTRFSLQTTFLAYSQQNHFNGFVQVVGL
ncbi:MAG: hypothetical protein HDT27_06950 [Subdoligranulum sp.]|nr:hypothetical protein [Subdoligranulum sp.]